MASNANISFQYLPDINFWHILPHIISNIFQIWTFGIYCHCIISISSRYQVLASIANILFQYLQDINFWHLLPYIIFNISQTLTLGIHYQHIIFNIFQILTIGIICQHIYSNILPINVLWYWQLMYQFQYFSNILWPQWPIFRFHPDIAYILYFNISAGISCQYFDYMVFQTLSDQYIMSLLQC